jgi:hypothetical protein
VRTEYQYTFLHDLVCAPARNLSPVPLPQVRFGANGVLTLARQSDLPDGTDWAVVKDTAVPLLCFCSYLIHSFPTTAPEFPITFVDVIMTLETAVLALRLALG